MFLCILQMCLYVSFPILVFYLTNTSYYSNKQEIRNQSVTENEENVCNSIFLILGIGADLN